MFFLIFLKKYLCLYSAEWYNKHFTVMAVWLIDACVNLFTHKL